MARIYMKCSDRDETAISVLSSSDETHALLGVTASCITVSSEGAHISNGIIFKDV